MAMPLALISKLKTSTIYSPCNGVIPIENAAPNKKIIASAALLAAPFVYTYTPLAVSPAYDAANCDAAIVIPSHTTVHEVKAKSSSGRRPILSTSSAPQMAHKNCTQLLMSVIFAWARYDV